MSLGSNIGAESAANEILVAIREAREKETVEEALDHVEQKAESIRSAAEGGWY